jgi:cytochrome c
VRAAWIATAAPRLIVIAIATSVVGCDLRYNANRFSVIPGGDPNRGADVIRARDCGTCHRIPGIHGADGTAAAPLTLMGRRTYIAGRLPNVPETMVRFILAPQDIDPRTAMPDLGLSEQEAIDVAAYLYTLR